MTIRRSPLLACLLVLIGASPAGAPPGAVFDAGLPDGRITTPVAALLEMPRLADYQDFRIVEIARDSRSSHHVVAIRTGEAPHRHDRHDLLVVMLRGHGFMRLGDEERPVGEGSILYVPRGTPHAFRNASAEPAVAYAVYHPPHDPTDRVPVE
jgi:mannose-6-phosphate isomerase-like protein (cupin superfamily)